MKNRQFIILCILIVIWFCILWYKQYKTDTRVEEVNERVSFRAEKIMELQKDYEFTADIVWTHSKVLRWDKKAR